MSEHQEKAERLDDQAEELERRSERLGDEISEVREDWEAMRRDESVPGAPAPESGLPPEANYVSSGDEPPQDGEGGDDSREPWPDE
jgi:hypothetical protein